MAVKEILTGLVQGAVAPIANIFAKKVERKIARDAINGRVEEAKLNNQAQVNIQTSEWESIKAAQEAGTWKDEYVTVSVFTIFNGVVLGSVASAFGIEGGTQMVTGILEAVRTLDALDGRVGDLIMVVAYAALSIKFVKDVVR